jgi:hypothetical protein
MSCSLIERDIQTVSSRTLANSRPFYQAILENGKKTGKKSSQHARSPLVGLQPRLVMPRR